MAKVVTNISEKVFNISTWRGVNEAAEGEARLKFGEAAVMRNFCVTSGGALKKRPGSRNVAGLMTDYEVRTAYYNTTLFTVRGRSSVEMFQRVEPNSLGMLQVSGDVVQVDSDDWSKYKGYYYTADGEVWALQQVDVRPAAGTESIIGGTGSLGQLRAFATGSVNVQPSGTTYTGTQSVQAYPSAALNDDGSVSVLGQAVTHPAAQFDGTGFSETDVGGFLLVGSEIWKYYGSRMEGTSLKYPWKKYAVNTQVITDTTYTLSEAVPVRSFWNYSDNPTYVTGYTGFSFNNKTGQFKGTGSTGSYGPGYTGRVYQISGSTLYMYQFQGRNGNSYVNVDSITAVPSSSTRTEVSLGARLGSAFAYSGALPDADLGYYQGSSLVDGGKTYTVMRSPSGESYAYIKDEEDPTRYGVYNHAFYGYPMTVEPNTYSWIFKKVYASPHEAEDIQVRAIWSGSVSGREVLCAACGGYLWELFLSDEGEWSKVPAGTLDTTIGAYMFGFNDKLYILTGKKYMVWDGSRLDEVEGYRPLVSVAVAPTGGGTLLEPVNRLTPKKRCWFSPDGEATTFQLPERDIMEVEWCRNLATGGSYSGYKTNYSDGIVTITPAPPKGVNTLEIAWTGSTDYRDQVEAMRFAELYNGAQDTRVFIYGDGSNRALYSGIDYDGVPRADYFPDLYEVAVGDSNTPITSMIRHYNKLMAFKIDSAWSVSYDSITLIDGTVTAGFYVTPVNRSIGNCAYGQAQLVQNRPRTLDARSVIEWRATSSGGITGDQRNAERVSQRVDSSIRKFDLSKARTFYDKFSHEYFVIGEDGTALVQNLDADAWYTYTNLDVTCMINYRDELYYGTRDGFLRHFSDRYFSDNGEPIDALWESGAISFNQDYRRKYSAMIWVGIKPEDNGYLEVSAETDRKTDFAVYSLATADAARIPEMARLKIKAKKFTYYKLIFTTNNADTTVTVVSADMRVRGTGYVR